ncbi:response regulator transcription factor [Usitatibacter palustris]|uniref:Sensor histidine kinase RcsC n=1 Tax=Usitatibacter palustris TaxID=2732487 RepID=A0A6M4H531_9PROT|nr:response regulator [Usitatibacter palustris]QJR13803.1 Sensor histidine kinase RcsC [Usitatibacter palustris]
MTEDFTLISVGTPAPSPAQVAQAESEAVVGTATLASRGFMVSFTKQSPVRLARKNGTQYVVQVIEDDPDLGQLLIDVLMTYGFEVRWATTKAEINAALRRGGEIDVLLLDRELPDANGLTILQAIRAHPQLNALPVIMVTGLATPADVAEGLVAGADGYVSKPFKLSGLVDAVNLVLGVK